MDEKKVYETLTYSFVGQHYGGCERHNHHGAYNHDVYEKSDQGGKLVAYTLCGMEVDRWKVKPPDPLLDFCPACSIALNARACERAEDLLLLLKGMSRAERSRVLGIAQHTMCLECGSTTGCDCKKPVEIFHVDRRGPQVPYGNNTSGVRWYAKDFE